MSLEDAVKKPLNDSLLELVRQGYTYQMLGHEYTSAILSKPKDKLCREDLGRMMRHEKDKYQEFMRGYFSRVVDNIWEIEYAPEQLLMSVERELYHFGTPWRMDEAVYDILQQPDGFKLLGEAVMEGADNYTNRQGVKYLPYAEYNAIYSAIRKRIEHQKLEALVESD